MGYVEIISTKRTVVRIENGVLTRGEMKFCDGHGYDRPAFNGVESVVTDGITLWLCEECANPEMNWADKEEKHL